MKIAVAGAGIAGLSAAVSAAEAGGRVVILERAPFGDHGGNTRWTDALMRLKSEEAVADDFEEHFAKNAGHHLDPLVTADLARDFETDFDRLTQVFINLISNAIRHGCAEGGQIEISANHTGDNLHVDVVDSGPGVPADKVDLMFEKFARLSAKATAGSAGLGLPISRQIMRNLGGGLDYLQRPAGSTFRVTTPISHTAVMAQSAA